MFKPVMIIANNESVGFVREKYFTIRLFINKNV